jgi:hypothetical protein
MTIHNVAGQVVEEAILRSQHGQVYLNADDYAPGTYILTLTTESGARVATQFLVQ